VSRERSDRVVRRFTLVTLVLPAVVTAVGLLVQLIALPHVPARIPLYLIGSGGSGSSGGFGGPSGSGGTGAPAGWEPVWLWLVLTVVLGFGLPAVFGLSSLPSLRRGDRSPTFRLFGAQALGLSALLTTISTSLVLQSIGTTSSDHSPVWFAVIAGLVVGVVAARVGWFLQPKGSRPAPERAINPLELAPGERAAWMRTAYLPVPAVAVITAAATIVGIKAGFGWVSGDRNGIAAILTVVALVLIALLATTAAFRVRVDTRGLSVRSIFGLPRFRVPLREVGSVAVVDARSLGVPGSWGIRARPSRVTIVMRSTTGIRVTRLDGRTFFVTVDDAATGVALLEALAVRAQKAAV
jgi:hypothetical protein